MAFMISQNQPSFSDEAEKIISRKEESERKGSISSHLLLKSSSQSLDKSVVLRRIRHHKAMNKVKNTLRALSRPDISDDYYSEEFYQHKWLQQGDCFTSP
ncbi:calcium-dependent protein kinase 33 [Striga asiatica]|uniref:Calcium-dependent protein kinase 33 n=1 Tax=Striga asiatica TaxID=4170 RepID=A0A5A7PDH1_STRAF|nr:calcium-dependent protein kinase 33 [Striga asiatica]